MRRSVRYIQLIVAIIAVGVIAVTGRETLQRTNAGDEIPQVTTTVYAGPPRAGGSVVYDLEADPNGLDPTRNAWDPSGLMVANAVFDTWTAYDVDANVVPYLAQSITHNEDYTVWTIKVRPNVKFHNGRPLNADAGLRIVNALKESVVTGQAAAQVGDAVKVDDQTVELHMKSSWASFPALLTGQGGYVVAPEQLDDPKGSEHPIGTGPFKLTDWQLGSQITLERNESYWRPGLPYLDRVQFQVETDPKTRLANVQAGRADIIASSTRGEIAQLDALPPDSGISVIHDKGVTESEFVMFNTAKPPFDDVRVRQAIAYATDVSAIAAANDWPKDRRADGPFAKDSPWYADTETINHDEKKAKELIASYVAEKGPIEVKLSSGIDIPVAQQLIDQWAKVGVKASLDVIDVHKQVLLTVIGQYDATLFRYFASPDPDVLSHFWISDTSRPIGEISLNFTRLEDDAIDKALRDGRATPDVAIRKKAYRIVQGRFATLVPYVWLTRVDWVIAHSTRVHDVANVTLPDGEKAMPYLSGVYRLTETWVES